MKLALPLSLALFLFVEAGISADELKLKDGSKIVGTIVGFEDNSFRVKTSYGFAVVQKDQVVSVKIDDASAGATENNPEPATAKMPAKPPAEVEPESKPKIPAHTGASDESTAKTTGKKSSAQTASPAVTGAPPTPENIPASPTSRPPSAAPVQIPAQGTSNSAAPASAKVSAPPPVSATAQQWPPDKPTPPPQPPPIREEVTGNTYTNDTYAFRMYKPPDWDVIASAQTILPGAVAAMGTADQTTYLIIGVEPVGKSVSGSIEATEKRLSGMLENFRDTGEQQITVSGLSSVEKHFHGGADGRDRSGVMVFLPRAGNLYTIFGMTYADNDLVQIQENVIGRAISSLQFLPQ